MAYRTLTEALQVLSASDRCITYLESRDQQQIVQFQVLHARALGILRHFQDRGLRPGDQVILLLNNNQQFIDGFWACLFGGLIPVPIAVGVSDEQRWKLFRVYRRLPNAFVYSDRTIWGRMQSFAEQHDIGSEFDALRSRALLTNDLHDISQPGVCAEVKADDIAFIQFSSGSTSEPKGVILTHANLLANIRDIIDAARFSSDDVSLSWMPLTHDMGLIGFHLNMLVCNMHHCLMATEVFIRRPLMWIQAANASRANILCSPNFGYRHFLKIFETRGLGDDDVDLSNVRLIFNGAEPISARLCHEFLDALAPYGLKPEAMFPVYGLAEASLAVSFPPLGRELRILAIDATAVGLEEHVRSAQDGDKSVECVSVGRPIGECRVRIAAESGALLPDGVVGRVLIAGPNVTSGYYLDVDATRQTIDAEGWLDTGDLGFMGGGELYITGRVKDIVFVNGQNFYAHDLEAVAVQSPHTDLGKLAVGAVRDEQAGTDRLLVFVLHRGTLSDFVAIAREIARLINEHTGAEVSYVVPVIRLPKTTSGKLQRYALVDAYARGEFDDVLSRLATLSAQASGQHEARTDMERTLQSICDQVLEGVHLGRHDNFFETGASSLKLIEIHERIEEQFPGRIELTDLFDYPTLAQLATFLEQRQSAV